MSRNLKDLLALSVAFSTSFLLFLFGIGFSLDLRVRGDAYGYLEIASKLSDFTSVYQYAGDRTIGLPFVEFLAHGVASWFFSPVSLSLWVNTICVLLYSVHMAASWLFSQWIKGTKIVQSEYSNYFLFFFLATYPAMVGYTTAPLSDTFAVDLALLAVVLLGRALRTERRCIVLFLSIGAGAIFGFSILVRPALMLGLGTASVVCGGVSLLGRRRIQVIVGTAVVACILVLTPYLANCTSAYGTYCLQSPRTFDAKLSIQEGLRGARISWSKTAVDLERLPMINDEIMFNNYYRKCEITGVTGLSSSSLTGCLLLHPLTLPSFVIKKWIGLFDHFRFTPYLEEFTPTWLKMLSRAYGALAWVGLCSLFLALVRYKKAEARLNFQPLLTQEVGLVLLQVFSIVLLAQHTALHTEDRYGFPLVPICAISATVQCEKIMTQCRIFGWRKSIPMVLFCLLALTTYLYQIISWDRAAISKIG